jgi:hypothetical protein
MLPVEDDLGSDEDANCLSIALLTNEDRLRLGRHAHKRRRAGWHPVAPSEAAMDIALVTLRRRENPLRLTALTERVAHDGKPSACIAVRGRGLKFKKP